MSNEGFGIHNFRTLDLHGSNYEEVVTKCHRFLNDHYGHDMYIITGNSSKMKEIVTEIIDKYRLHYNVGGITGTYGYIRIYRKE